MIFCGYYGFDFRMTFVDLLENATGQICFQPYTYADVFMYDFDVISEPFRG